MDKNERLLGSIETKLEVIMDNQKSMYDAFEHMKADIYIGSAARNSILNRLAELENAMIRGTELMDEYQTDLTTFKQEMYQQTFQIKLEDRKGRWQVITILLVSICGFVGVAISSINPKLGEWAQSILLNWLSK